jgi:hypothetical protein
MKSVLKRASTFIFAISAISAVAPASAAQVQFVAVPTTWLVQYYTATATRPVPAAAVFYTALSATTYPCVGPASGLSVSGVIEAKRFFDFMVTAKIAQQKVTIYFDDQTCAIDSFGLSN